MLFKIHLFILFLLAPFIGLGVAYAQLQPFTFNEMETLALQEEPFREDTEQVYEQIYSLTEQLQQTRLAVEQSKQYSQLLREEASGELRAYEEQHAALQEIVRASGEHQLASGDMLDYLLANMLGDPVGQTFGEKATVKVYSLEEVGYRGYMAKVRVHNVDAIRMLMADDQVGSRGETTSAAARRSEAVLAVNAGGFASQNGLLYPVGITVIDGEVKTFADLHLSFVGFNRSGQLVGGNINTREELAELDVLYGASFLPTLLKDGVKQPIPGAWANTRHPRTLIGHFENDDLLIIVIDGRRDGWSMGVTLEEAQEKLLEFNVRDAYNLDGGGSSTFYYDGAVLNRPSGGAERRVTTNLVVIP